ncbi:uncharacterized protein [Oryza sativa Japonica Group]|uniref:uncharacterized protein n=1 Tax=Oryza sativa subsp. japonica TaxID=39947 RepID=UPI00339BFC98
MPPKKVMKEKVARRKESNAAPDMAAEEGAEPSVPVAEDGGGPFASTSAPSQPPSAPATSVQVPNAADVAKAAAVARALQTRAEILSTSQLVVPQAAPSQPAAAPTALAAVQAQPGLGVSLWNQGPQFDFVNAAQAPTVQQQAPTPGFGTNQAPIQATMTWSQPIFDPSMAAQQVPPVGAGQPNAMAQPCAQAAISPFATPYPQQGAVNRAGGEKGLPLSGGIKTRPIPPQFKFPPVPRYSGETDPKEFLSIYESAIEAAHGDETTKAKVIHLALDGIGRSWYFNLPANSIYSWEQLRDVFFLNFRGTYEEPKTQQHLLGIRQRQGESIREYMRRFSQARCQVQDITEASVINAASAGLLEGELTRKIANMEPQTLEHLLRIIDGFARGEEDSKRRQAIQAEYDKASVAAVQAQAQVQVAEPPPLFVRQSQPAIQGQPPRQGQAPITWRKFRTGRAGKAVMAVEEVQALRKEFDAQQASNHQQPARKKVRKDLYCAFHGRSSHTTEQCRNIRQRGNAQDPRPQQGTTVEAPREAVQEQTPPAEQRQDVQRRVIQVITRADPPSQLSKRQKKMQIRMVHSITSAGEGAPQYLNQLISFRPEDAEGVMFPHQDPLGENRREEQILFDVVDIPYNYNAIFGRATLNKFEAISHHNYLKLKMPGPTGVIVVKGLQPSAASKGDLAIINRAVNSVETEPHERPKHTPKPTPHGKITKVQIDDADPTKLVSLGGDMGEEEVESILQVLKKNIDIFAWCPDEVGGVPADLIMHHLAFKPDIKPRKQKLRKMSADRQEAAKAEVQKLLRVGVIQEIDHPEWLVNPVLIHMNLLDVPKTSFITPFGTFCHLRMPFGLRNAGATFARLVYKVLGKQLGRNVEAYVDDIVVKSRKAFDHAIDLQETFDSLRTAGIRLNLEKCVFGVRAGKEVTGWLSKWAAELSPFDLHFVACSAIKSQVLADFVAEWTPVLAPDPEPAEQFWVMCSDGSWSHKGAGIAAVLFSPNGVPIRYAARLQIDTTNNAAE